MSDLQGRRIAFLVTNGYEPSELYSPWDTVVENGAEAVLISPESGEVSGGDHSQKVDLHVSEVNLRSAGGLAKLIWSHRPEHDPVLDAEGNPGGEVSFNGAGDGGDIRA